MSFSKLNMIFCLIAVVACGGCQSEVAKWDLARGLNLERAGETDLAIQQLQNSVTKSRNDSGIKLELARMLAEQGNRDSIRLCDEVIKKKKRGLTQDDQSLKLGEILWHLAGGPIILHEMYSYDFTINFDKENVNVKRNLRLYRK